MGEQNIVENANESIAVVQNGIIEYINSAGAGHLGYEVEELAGQPFTKFMHPKMWNIFV